jgi:PST family polysaccharide transporter
VVQNHPVCNRLVLEQIEIGTLLAAPGLLVVIALAPFVLSVLYSKEFIAAYNILQWQILGTYLRVVTWPVGYIILAKGAGRLFILTELFSNAILLALTYIAIQHYGLRGTGMAFFCLYIAYFFVVTIVSFRLTSFRWQWSALRHVTFSACFVLLGFGIHLLFNGPVAIALGLFLALILDSFSLIALCHKVGRDLALSLRYLLSYFIRPNV